MPSNVARFELLMYVSLVIGAVNSALQFQALTAQASPAFILGIQGFVFALFILLIWLIARKRQNWARWTFLVLFVIGLPFSVPQLLATLQTSPVSAGLSVVQIVMQAYALFLIFTGNAKDWFRKTPVLPA